MLTFITKKAKLVSNIQNKGTFYSKYIRVNVSLPRKYLFPQKLSRKYKQNRRNARSRIKKLSFYKFFFIYFANTKSTGIRLLRDKSNVWTIFFKRKIFAKTKFRIFCETGKMHFRFYPDYRTLLCQCFICIIVRNQSVIISNAKFQRALTLENLNKYIIFIFL
jgi:hypothetical protein